MFRRMAAAAALLAVGGPAQAIVGGAEHTGALARTTVMVLTSRPAMCSAVVLAPDVVLTAAHCVTGAPDYRVHFKDEDGRPVLRELAAKAVHPDYDAKAVEARRRSIDLALVRLAEPLPDRFAAATLATSVPAKDSAALIGGWGRVREPDRLSSGTFRTAEMRVVEPYGPSKILVWLKTDETRGACHGDSGGPILQSGKVVAITAWAAGPNGRGCGGTSQGMLVSPQKAWIDRTLGSWGRTAAWE